MNSIIKFIDKIIYSDQSLSYIHINNHECGMCYCNDGRYIKYNNTYIKFTNKVLNYFKIYQHRYLIDAIIEFILWQSIRCNYLKYTNYYVYGEFIFIKSICATENILEIDLN